MSSIADDQCAAIKTVWQTVCGPLTQGPRKIADDLFRLLYQTVSNRAESAPGIFISAQRARDNVASELLSTTKQSTTFKDALTRVAEGLALCRPDNPKLMPSADDRIGVACVLAFLAGVPHLVFVRGPAAKHRDPEADEDHLLRLAAEFRPVPLLLAQELHLTVDDDDRRHIEARQKPLPADSATSQPDPDAARTDLIRIAPSRLFWGKNTGPQELVGRNQELEALNNVWSGTENKRVVTIAAWGGVGKTSLVAHWAATKLADPAHGGIERYFDWSFYSQGTRADSDPARADKGSSADVFIKEALEFFGDTDCAASNRGPWHKGERLAHLVAQHRTLLIIDGLEPLQDAKSGELHDDALRALFRGLAANARGLCLITTRQHLPDLDFWRKTTSPEWRLQNLSTEAGRQLLQILGVKGTLSEFDRLSDDLKGHALTLRLLGKYLTEAHAGDIRRRDEVSLRTADYEETSGHAFSVMAAYERWFERDSRYVELALLRLLGLFDRPATPASLTALRRASIEGLTDVPGLPDPPQWNLAIARLCRLGLVEEQPWHRVRLLGYTQTEAENALKKGFGVLGEPRPLDRAERAHPADGDSCLDTHPLIREYFGNRLRGSLAWRAAHDLLFEYLTQSVPFWPEGLTALQPLYQAIGHGCEAGRYQDALLTYEHRIRRSPFLSYSAEFLGATGADLAVLRGFFDTPWTRATSALDEAAQRWLLNEAAGHLMVLGRLQQAREPLLIVLEHALSLKMRDWKDAKSRSCALTNMADVELSLGDVESALNHARQGVHFADLSAVTLDKAQARGMYAYALNHAGLVDEARREFMASETLAHEAVRRVPGQYVSAGFQMCEFMQDEAERAAWRQFLQPENTGATTHTVISSRYRDIENRYKGLRAARRRASVRLPSVTYGGELVLYRAHVHLILGRDEMYRAILESTLPQRSREMASHLTDAVRLCRESGEHVWLPKALPSRAWMHVLLGDVNEALTDLAEAQQLAEHGPLPLVLADIHLHRARLLWRYDLTTARRDLAQARLFIETHGYRRRLAELEDAEAVLLKQLPP